MRGTSRFTSLLSVAALAAAGLTIGGVALAGPAAAATPCIATIQVLKTSNSSSLGYISDTLTPFDTLQPTTAPANYQEFSMSATGGTEQLIALAGNSSSTPYFAAVEGVAGNTFGAGNAGYAFASEAAATSPGATPTSGNSVIGPEVIESAIWSINTSTGALTPTWINPDGAAAPTYVFNDISFGDLDFTGDLSAFNAQFGDTVQQVSFVASPVSGCPFGQQQSQSVHFDHLNPSPVYVGQLATVTATATSGLTAAVTIDASTSGFGTATQACSISGSTVNFDHAGTCDVDANQAGNAQYTAASQQQQVISVGKADQQIVFDPTSDGVIGDTRQITATSETALAGNAPTGLTVALTSTTPTVCSVSGTTVSLLGSGTCTIEGDQSGSPDFNAAAATNHSFGVAKKTQSITINSANPSPVGIGSQDVVDASSDSGLSVALSIDGSTTGDGTAAQACSISDATVSFDHAGTCIVDADQAGNATYSAATEQQQTITVDQTSQTIMFMSQSPNGATVGGGYDVSASGGGSGNPVTFTSTTPATCTVSAAAVTFIGAGKCTVEADQAGNTDYAPADPADQDTQVGLVRSHLSLSAPSAVVFGQPVTATAGVTVDSGTAAGTVQFSVNNVDLGGPVNVVNGSATSPTIAEGASGTAYTVSATFTPTDTATYQGDSDTAPLTVGPASTSTTVAVAAHQLTATVSAVAPGSGTPTGTVTFSVGGSPVGTGTLSGGVATLAYTTPTGKTQTVGAAYGGATDFAPSSASTARHDPTITAVVKAAHSPQHGWFRSPVTVTFTCKTDGAPLTKPCPSPVVLSKNTAGTSVSRTISATDGGMATVNVGPLRIDQTPPTVTITGVKNGASYGLTSPTPTCSAHDALSGVVSCRLTSSTKGDVIHYRAVATDKAGNHSAATATITVVPLTIESAPLSDGAYTVHRGRTYTVVAIGAKRPRYIDAAPYAQLPRGDDAYFIRDGSIGGTPRWLLAVTMGPHLASHRYWDVGVKVGGTLYVLKIRVLA